MIGRHAAWEKLQTAWQRACRGHPHFVCISGEAGIGKTRLAEALLTWAHRQGIPIARTRSYAAEGELAYAPIIEWLRSEHFQHARKELADVWLSEVARLLPEILLERPDLPRPEPLSERWQRQRLFEALARAIFIVKQPLLLAVDDLQWADSETLEWLHYLLRFDANARLLIVGTVRTEEVDEQHALLNLLRQMRRSDQVTELELARLDEIETAALAAQVAGQPLDAQSVKQIYQQTAGNPLFVVEMVRSAFSREEEGGFSVIAFKADAPAPLPPKVQAVLQARLSQLSPPARTLAHLAAVIGRAFTFDELAQAGERDPGTIVQALDELWQRRIVREHSSNAYDFSHDLIRDVAYAEISPARRRALHERVAEAFRQLYENDLDAVSAALAAHYEQAGMQAQASRRYQQAATVAEQRFDFQSAIHYLDTSLALQQKLPHTKQWLEQELTLLLAKAANLVIVKGFTSPEVANVNEQVEPIVALLDDDHLRFYALQRLRQFYGAVGKMDKAQKYAQQLLSIALRLQEPELLLAAYQAYGVVNLQLGHLPVAKEHLLQGEALESKKRSRRGLIEDGHRGKASILANLALTLWLLGYPEQALVKMSESLAVAEMMAHPFQLSIVLFFATLLYAHMREAKLIAAPTARVFALDAQYHIRISGPAGGLAQGWLLAEQDKLAEGIAQMRTGIDGYKAFNHLMFQTHRLGLLIEAQLKAKQFDIAAATLAEAFALSEQSGQRSWDADLYRLKGDLLCAVNASDAEVAIAYEQAIQLARQQAAKSLELRAAMNLARLWQSQGKSTEAYALLEPIYNWFTEGFETADLQAAQTLLAELTPSTPR